MMPPPPASSIHDLRAPDPTYRTSDVEAVDGSHLRVGWWGDGGPVVVAVHGLTLTHAQFHPLGRQLAGRATLVAPDLRGRGASAAVAPYGMAAHARDVQHIVEDLDSPDVTLLGYSTGAAVATIVAAERPDLVDRVVLVDGGPPPDPRPPTASSPEAPVAHVLERLGCTFASSDDYLDLWRGDPGLIDDWDDDVARVFAGDLVGDAPDLRVGISAEALVADSSSYLDGRDVDRAFDALRCPVLALTAPRGMGASATPLVPDAKVRAWQARVSQLVHVVVPDVNHHTILFSARGARVVAAMIGPGNEGPGAHRPVDP
jgi:lipase